MKGVVSRYLFFIAFAYNVAAQPSLQFFTNQANALLEAQFGFTVTNVPIYSPTNPAISYSASLHYLLQSAANAYDATTPATNLPSVFRPLFGWQSNTLYIVGYAAVTNDFYSQTSTGFKDLTNSTITTNDNVWGIPWVVGAKGQVPAFNEYSYSTAVLAARRVFFVRWKMPNGQPDTNRPPEYTNQMFVLNISNSCGVQSWNAYPDAFTNSVTMITSNTVCLYLTNDYDWGTNMVFSSGGSCVSNSWAAWSGNLLNRSSSFGVPFLTNTTFLPPSYWSESTKQFVPLNGITADSSVLPSDSVQTGWPVHTWILNITNDLMYAMIDNQTGQVLDYVNLSAFGSSLNISEQLAGNDSTSQYWTTGNATDLPNSPISPGMLNQIAVGETSNPLYYGDLTGTSPSVGGLIFDADFDVSNLIIQVYGWLPPNPRVHYTFQDLTPFLALIENPEIIPSGFILTNSVSSEKVPIPYYNSGLVESEALRSQNGNFQMQFPGVTNMPYTIWGSPDLLNWSQIGIAAQPTPGNFQFTDNTVTNFPARFYEVRLP